MTTRSILTPLLLFLVGIAVMWTFLTLRYASAEDVPGPGPAVSMLFDAGADAPTTNAATNESQVSSSPPDPEFDLGAFLRIVWTVGKTSIPAAAVFVCFGLVTVARRRWPPAREGTTGVLTATVLTALTYAVSMLATGASVGTAVGGAVIALLTGRAMATQVQALPAKAVR